MEFFVCFDEFYKMAKKHDGVKKIVVHFFLKSVIMVYNFYNGVKIKFQHQMLIGAFE